MEEDKAAAYYDELTRKGEGAARFKQGLGYSSSPSNPPPSITSSFLTGFVRASSPSTAAKLQKEAEFHRIQTKLNKSKHTSSSSHSHSSDRDLGHKHRHRSSREEKYHDREESSRRRGERDEDDYHDREESSRRRRERDERRSSSRRHRSRSSDEEERSRRRRRSRSSSPRSGRSERRGGDSRDRRRVESRSQRSATREKNTGSIDYSRLIDGYDEMTPPERVKAKMKLQLSQTAAKDTFMTAGWERFDFNKDAPLDDEEIEVAEDDAALVKDLGRSFRFSAVEAKREADIQAAHDEAIFGTSAASPVDTQKDHVEKNIAKESEESSQSIMSANLMSDKVMAMQQGSWRDRASKLRHGSNS